MILCENMADSLSANIPCCLMCCVNIQVTRLILSVIRSSVSGNCEPRDSDVIRNSLSILSTADRRFSCGVVVTRYPCKQGSEV